MPPILPASPHARGARPYEFRGEWYGASVPGVIVRQNGNGTATLKAAVDAAWLFSGLQCTRSVSWLSTYTREIPGLYAYQVAGAFFLWSRDYALLADEMGLGKTVQALCAAELRLQSARGAQSPDEPHVLILCPALAKRHWAREVEKWTGRKAAILEGLTATDLPQARYIIANYDILYGQRRKDAAGKMHEVAHLGGWRTVLQAAKFPIVICDEAHLLRGEKSQRTKAVKEVADPSTCVWMLTGTPMPNHVRDLWALWDLASKGLAGYFWPWAKAYCGAYKSQYGWVADGQSGLEELGKRLSFWMLGRSKAVAGLELPEKRREILTVDVGEVKPPVPWKTEAQSKTNRVALALRATAAAKQPAIVEMAKEALSAKQKVVVFVYLRAQADSIAKALVEHRVFAVSGEMSPESRDAAALEFRNTTGAAVFVATIDSVGVAISLVGADLVIFGDLVWEPAKLLQAEGRAHRHGSTTRVLVRYVIAAGTIDEKVAESVVDKLATMEQALGANPDGTELSVQLGRDMSTTEQILDKLFQSLTGG